MVAAGRNNANLTRLVKHFFHSDNKSFDLWKRYIEDSEATPDEDQKEKRGTATPLYYAALLNLPEVMKHVLVQDASQLNKVGGEYGTPLQAVCFKGHESALRLLLDWGADPDTEGGKFGVPINAAIAEGHGSLVKTLLDKGVNHTLKDLAERTPLYTAAKNGNHIAIRWLIEAGAERETTNKYGQTPLNAAAGGGHIDVVRLLLEKGADMTVASNGGWTPLNSAADSGHIEVVKYLLKHGSGVNSLDAHYGSILNLFVFKGYTELLRIAYEQHQADKHLKDLQNRTPLQLAARGGHMDAFLYLLHLGLDPTVEDAKGDGLISYASSGGSLDVLDAAFKETSNFSSQIRNWSPLHWACRAGVPDVVERLIKEGANSGCVTVAQPEGRWSPLSIAIFHGKEEMLENLSTSCISLLSAEANAVRLDGERHGGYWCNGCLHVSE
jgi:ankyrin repeat protein